MRSLARPARWALLLAAAGACHASPALAQEIQLTGPLVGAPAPRAAPLPRADRVLVAAGASFVAAGGAPTPAASVEALWHARDWIGVGLFGAGPWRDGAIAEPEVALIPWRDRVRLPAVGLVAADAHLHAGPAWTLGSAAPPSPRAAAGAGIELELARGVRHQFALGVDYRALVALPVVHTWTLSLGLFRRVS